MQRSSSCNGPYEKWRNTNYTADSAELGYALGSRADKVLLSLYGDGKDNAVVV